MWDDYFYCYCGNGGRNFVLFAWCKLRKQDKLFLK